MEIRDNLEFTGKAFTGVIYGSIFPALILIFLLLQLKLFFSVATGILIG